MTTQTFPFFIPPVNLMGIGCHKEIGKRAKILGMTKPLVVTDKGVVQTGMGEQICALLRAEGLKPTVFADTVPNPTDTNVAAGVKVYKKNGCDSLITLGGGSPHDCGKGIGLLVSNGGAIHDYEGLDKSTKPLPPYIAVNTTSGTASEMTRFCIITDTRRKVKMAIVDWRVTPTLSVDDPLLMVGMPPKLTAATGMDALTHAVEAYVSTIASPITDACALKAIELIAGNLRAAVANGQDLAARDAMTYAEFLAGMAFNNASLGNVHAMAHQLGGFYDLPHGVCNAILLPHVERFNMIAKLDRFVVIAKTMGEPVDGLSQRAAAERALEAIKQLSVDVGIPAGLQELGVKEKDFPLMAENAMKDACSFTNPRLATLGDIVQIYKNAL
ncbi:MAG: iron-containing alcohol dehydrogenase [Verrucomicrobia bacterium]|nr:iron-containing alcohol dehydrogenase [Verrucomicrobiota bacterium]